MCHPSVTPLSYLAAAFDNQHHTVGKLSVLGVLL